MYEFLTSNKSSFSTFACSEGVSSLFAEEAVETDLVTTHVSEVVPIDDLIEIDVSDIDFTSIAIAGQEYDITFDESAIEAGQYYYDFEQSKISIKLDKPVPVTRVYFRADAGELKSSVVEIGEKEFFTFWNVHDKIELTRSLNGFPSCSLTFTVQKKNILATRLQLKNGNLQTLFGIPFRIKSLSFKPRSKSPTTLYDASVSFISKYAPYNTPSRNPLDKAFKLKGDSCDNPTTGWQSLSSYLNKVSGAPQYFGKPIYIFVSKNTSSEATTTARKVLTERAITNQQFLYYSSPLGIYGKDWGKTTKHNCIPKSNYLDVISHNFNGAGYTDPNTQVQLIKEYRNTEFKMSSPEEIEEDQEKPVITTRWEFERAGSLADCQTPAEPYQVGDSIFVVKSPSSKIFRDPGQAFDTGGFTKVAHKITEMDGVEVFRETKVFGWIFTSLDTYSVIDKDAVLSGDSNYASSVAIGDFYRIIYTPEAKFSFKSSAWTEVESYTTNRYFDDQGYLYKSSTFGKKLFRLSQDNDQLEGITTLFTALELLTKTEKELEDAQDPEVIEELNKQLAKANALIQLANSYRFTSTEPISKIITYQAVPYSTYYSDITKPSDQCTWVEPKFLLKSITNEIRREVTKNPGSTPDFPLPPIVNGKIFTEITSNVITSRKKPGRYITKRYMINIEGEGLRRKLKFLSSQEHIGRPSNHQKREITEISLPATFTSGLAVNNTLAQAVSGSTSANQEYKYLLNSPGTNPNGDITEGTLSVPDVFDSSLAKKIAETQLSIDNTTKAEILTIQLLYDSKYNEGDRYIYEGKEYVILQIKFSIEVNEKFKIIENFQMQLGRLIKVPVTIKEVQNNPTKKQSQNGVLAFAINSKALELKSIFNNLAPGTVANLIKLDLLDEFVDAANLRVLSESDFDKVDGINNFLTKGIGTTPSGGAGSGFGNTIQPTFEDGITKDLRTKTPIERFADLINRIAALNDFNAQLENLLGDNLLKQLKGEVGQEAGGGGGGLFNNLPSSNSPAPPIFVGPKPNVTLKGGDNLLAKLLEGLLGGLGQLLKLLGLSAPESEEGGDAGGAGGAGGSGGDPQGGGAKPVLLIGDLAVYIETPDILGLFNMILGLIDEAIALAQDFDLTLEEALDRLLSAAKKKTGTQTSSGSAGGGSGTGGQTVNTNVTTEFIVPPFDGVANIEITEEEADISKIDLNLLFNSLDKLLKVLKNLAAEQFDFEINLDLLAEGAGVPNVVDPQNGYNPVFAEDIDIENSPGISTSSGPPLINSYTNQVLVELTDISGVITQGAGTYQRPKGGLLGGLLGGSGGITSGQGSGGLSSGGLSNVGGLVNDSAGTTTTGGSLSSSGGLTSSPNYTGDPGDFGYNGFNSPNDGFGDVQFVPDTDFSVTPVQPSNSGVEIPVSTVDEMIADTTNEYVIAPESFTHVPAIDGNFVLVSGAVASSQVIWEIVSDSTGIELRTPYDLDLTLEFVGGFVGGSIELKVSLRGAPEIFDTVFVDTVYTSRIDIENFYGASEAAEVTDDWKVDVNLLFPTVITGTTGIAIASQVDLTWNEPAGILKPISYTVLEKQPDNSFLAIATSPNRNYLFDINVTYRIDANYDNQMGSVASEPFIIDKPPIIGREEQPTDVTAIANEFITPISTEPANFFTIITAIGETEIFINEGKYYAVADESITPISTEPINFFNLNSNIDETDVFVNEGKQYAVADEFITPISTEPDNFYSI